MRAPSSCPGRSRWLGPVCPRSGRSGDRRLAPPVTAAGCRGGGGNPRRRAVGAAVRHGPRSRRPVLEPPSATRVSANPSATEAPMNSAGWRRAKTSTESNRPGTSLRRMSSAMLSSSWAPAVHQPGEPGLAFAQVVGLSGARARRSSRSGRRRCPSALGPGRQPFLERARQPAGLLLSRSSRWPRASSITSRPRPWPPPPRRASRRASLPPRRLRPGRRPEIRPEVAPRAGSLVVVLHHRRHPLFNRCWARNGGPAAWFPARVVWPWRPAA